MTDLHSEASSRSRSAQLDRAIRALLAQAPELEAAAVVSFDGLPMAAALPPSMDEDRVAAMSAALLSLGERAAEGLGRGELSQVYIEGDNGTVFLVSADDEAVLVAVASKGAKAGMMMYEVRRAAAVVATVLRAEGAFEHQEVAAPAPGPDIATAPEPIARIPAQAPSAAAVEPSYQPTHEQPEYLPPTYAVTTAADSPHDVSVYDLPVYDTPAAEVSSQEVPEYDLPQYEVSQYEPIQEAPVYSAPQYPEPTRTLYSETVHSAPVYTAPVYTAPVYTEPAAAPSAVTEAEPVWPPYTPTGSVMPGGGVPPSTWS